MHCKEVQVQLTDDLPLVISDSQGVFTADPQCVAGHYAQEWKREGARYAKHMSENLAGG